LNLREEVVGEVQPPSVNDAVALGALGYYVFPVRKYDKQPAIRNWKTLASGDEMHIRTLWIPDSNIGIACGASNIAILDIDPRHDGDKSIKELEHELGVGIFDDSPCVLTPSGGRHYYFQQPAGQRISNSVGILPGIDIRGDGGLVVAPPSVFVGADYQGEYRWLRDNCVMRPFPSDILKYSNTAKVGRVMRRSHKACRAVGATGGAQSSAWTEGSRNSKLTRIAGHFWNQGLSGDELRMVLRGVNNAGCKPPLPDIEVGGIARSADRTFDRRFDAAAVVWEWQRRGLRGKSLELLVAIAGVADSQGRWSPNRAQLMRAANIRSLETFYKARKTLIDMGVIDIENRGRNESTGITIKWPSDGLLLAA
jgi:hypothetical protein